MSSRHPESRESPGILLNESLQILADRLPDNLLEPVKDVMQRIQFQRIVVTPNTEGIFTPHPSDAQMVTSPLFPLVIAPAIVINPGKFLGFASNEQRAIDLTRTVYVASTLPIKL